MTLPLLAVFLAIAITTTMDAVGLSAFSALPLAALLALFWALERLSRREVGFVAGRVSDYGLALLYPVAVMSPIALAPPLPARVDLSRTDWQDALTNFAAITVATLVVAIVTEEGLLSGLAVGFARAARIGASCDPRLDQPCFRAVACVGRAAADQIRPARLAGAHLPRQRGIARHGLGPARATAPVRCWSPASVTACGTGWPIPSSASGRASERWGSTRPPSSDPKWAWPGSRSTQPSPPGSGADAAGDG